jgi:hypothetical protein
MVKYSCGHESNGMIVIDDNLLSMTAYLEWSETVGINGDKSKCWECFCNTDELKELLKKKVENENT